jgi:hypothetical protein
LKHCAWREISGWLPVVKFVPAGLQAVCSPPVFVSLTGVYPMTRTDVLSMLAEKKIDVAEASRLLSTMDRPASGKLTLKVSEKGAISVYGLQRMPVTLYVEQWERLLGISDDIKAFAKSNDKKLTRKAG